MRSAWCMVLLSLVLGAVEARTGEAWRFLVIADWHSAEKFVQPDPRPEWVQQAAAKDVATVRALKQTYGGDVILLPGDSNKGHWDFPAFIRKFKPGLTPQEAILQAGHRCYSGMIDVFRQGGYERLLMAVGDHELGDNPWPAKTSKARCQPQFRETFAREFNRRPDGSFRWDRPVGDAPARPVGTPYENTSYAWAYRNALFVTVDVFRHESAETVIGDEGTVTGAVTGRHLEWLEQVLAAARRQPGIRHVFVQAHLPVLHPVRKVSSSGMLMDDGPDSAFWQALRRHRVDVYFAGEVHANTATRDTGSDLVQVVSRGNGFTGFLAVDVADDVIDIAAQCRTDAETATYRESGRLKIDKSGARTVFSDDGELALLDRQARLIHFPFGQGDAAPPDRPMAHGAELRGVTCDQAVSNRGAFGPQYDAQGAALTWVPGPRGKAAEFTTQSRMAVFAMGPHHSSYPISCALWVRTDQTGSRVLINSGAIWRRGGLRGFFNLNLVDGVPEVRISDTQSLLADGARLNDGKWHHLAAVMPEGGCRLSNVRIYVDGKAMPTRVRGADAPIHFEQSVRLSFGGYGFSRADFDRLPAQAFAGAMDEISFWARPLTPAEVAELARFAP